MISAPPPYWKNETSGKLKNAILALMDTWTDKHYLLSPQELETLKDYLTLWIDYPEWDRSGQEQQFELLSSQLKSVTSTEQLNQWLDDALHIGIDPL